MSSVPCPHYQPPRVVTAVSQWIREETSQYLILLVDNNQTDFLLTSPSAILFGGLKLNQYEIEK